MTATTDRRAAETFASAAAGDEIAFARIVATHDDEMYRVCVAVCRDQTIAADAVQAAWIIAWRKLDRRASRPGDQGHHLLAGRLRGGR